MNRSSLVSLLLGAMASVASADCVIVFNEIMYHPPTGDGGPGEWIEFHNQMGIDIDMSRWHLEGGVEFAFPEGTIVPGGGYLVVANDPGKVAGALGPMKGRLGNRGERLRLMNNSGRLMNELAFDDQAPWPKAPDGSGATLAKWNIDGASEDPRNWTWSAEVGGTPGVANFSAIARPSRPAWINELSAGGGNFWLEVANLTNDALNLEGWLVRAGAKEAKLKSVSVPANGFAVIDANALGFLPEVDDEVVLLNAAGASVIDAVEVRNRPQGRRPGDARWWTPTQATPGAANVFQVATDVVINEIMYHHRPQYEDAGEYGPAQATPIEAEWRYNDTGKIEDDWSKVPHPAWPKGKGMLGNVASVDGLPELIRTNLPGGRLAYYFEMEFDLPDAAHEVMMKHVVRDGAVFYLNGQEVLRHNMPDGPVKPSTLASSKVAAPTLSALITLPQSAVVSGKNRLSVEVHEDDISATDFVFGLELQTRKIIRPARAFERNPEEWIELHNRGQAEMDLAGWSLAGDVFFNFAQTTKIPASGYVVVAKDAARLRTKFPGVTILGDWSGTLGDRTGEVLLLDARGNLADEVRYHDSGRWPETPDGGGSSLELRDPNADNSAGESWAASDESARSQWVTYRYRGPLRRSAVGADTQWSELVMGLHDAGECWIDDLSLIEEPGGSGVQFIPTGTFTDAVVAGPGVKGWRLIGTHRHGVIIADPADPSNKILRVVASGSCEHMHNHIEITFPQKPTNTREYELSFRAKYISGSPLLNVRVYFNRSPVTAVLAYPEKSGTPGARNSRWQADIGPSYQDLRHEPVVPAANQDVTVSVLASHAKGEPTLTLKWAPNGTAPFNSVPMTRGADGRHSGKIPGQAAAAIAQFYVEGAASTGATSFMPLAGPDSRALVQWQDGKAATNGLRNVRLIMAEKDNAFLHTEIQWMSNDRIPLTVVVDEREAVYNAGVRLKGSQRGRVTQPRLGYSAEFPSDQLYHGVHGTLSLDRSEGVGFGQQELLINQMFTHAGCVSTEYNELAFLIAPRATYTGTIEIQMARFGQHMLDSQFQNGGDGMVYEYELIYYPTSANADGFKKPQPDTVVGTGFRNMGDFKEDYRWNFLLKNNKDQDDFRPIIRLNKLFGLTGAAFNAQVADVIDVENWCRGVAFSNISGAGDQYGANDQHNGVFYAKPNGKFIYFPHDLDFAFSNTRNITENNDLRKIIANPVYKRYYYAQLWDIITHSYNRTYMSRWADLFKKLAPAQNWAAHLNFINSRSTNVRTQLTRAVPAIAFAISTNEGNDFEVAAPVAEIRGKGWLNVNGIKRVETGQELDVTWLDGETWLVEIPLLTGANTVTLQAFNYRGDAEEAGAAIGQDSIRVTNTGVSAGALTQNLAITEIMYHPADPSAKEKAAGFLDADFFEYIELTNLGSAPIDLSQVRFSNGIDFAFAAGARLAPNQIALLVRDKKAFAARYGANLTVLGEWTTADNLSNGGERLTLKGPGGLTVQSVKFGDRDPWPREADGEGSALEIKNPASNADDPANWAASVKGGTPGLGKTSVGGTYAKWKTEKFSPAEQTDAKVSGELANPDGDIFLNLVEYALGTDPKATTSGAILKQFSDGSGQYLEFPRNPDAGDMDLLVERSADARTWQDASALLVTTANFLGRYQLPRQQLTSRHYWRLRARLK